MAFACTVTVAGMVTAALLLVRLTVPLDEPEVSFTVQVSVPSPFGGVFV